MVEEVRGRKKGTIIVKEYGGWWCPFTDSRVRQQDIGERGRR